VGLKSLRLLLTPDERTRVKIADQGDYFLKKQQKRRTDNEGYQAEEESNLYPYASSNQKDQATIDSQRFR